jgi:ABC-type branched-subunit amino acid transport system ATPase component
MSELVIKNLHVGIEDNEILKGFDLTVRPGEIHAIMGPNGTGKSTLAYALMGHPNYDVTDGKAMFKGENILDSNFVTPIVVRVICIYKPCSQSKSKIYPVEYVWDYQKILFHRHN